MTEYSLFGQIISLCPVNAFIAFIDFESFREY